MSAPAVNRQATLSIPGLEELQARVAAVSDEHTDLWLLQRPRSAASQLHSAQAFLDYMTDEGVWRTIGTVRVIDNNATNSLRFEPRGRVQLLQRRAYVRTDCVAAVIMMPPGGNPSRCLTINVSGGGLLVRGLTGVEPGAIVPFDLHLDLLPARIQGTCEVVRITPEGLVGVQFADIDGGDRDKLIHFAYARERSANEQRRKG
jgi:PilZ domain-containing protein